MHDRINRWLENPRIHIVEFIILCILLLIGGCTTGFVGGFLAGHMGQQSPPLTVTPLPYTPTLFAGQVKQWCTGRPEVCTDFAFEKLNTSVNQVVYLGVDCSAEFNIPARVYPRPDGSFQYAVHYTYNDGNVTHPGRLGPGTIQHVCFAVFWIDGP